MNTAFPKAEMIEPAFVGRVSELEQLEHMLDSASDSNGGTVFVIGEAGAGKSRLVKEFLTFAERKGARILAGFCLSNTPVPYFPFIEAFQHLSSMHNDKDGASIVDGFSLIEWLKGVEVEEVESIGVKGWIRGPKQQKKHDKVADLSPEIRKDITHTTMVKTLTSLSSKQPLIMFIDDVHWADSASLSLLHYISRAIGSLRVLILATARSEELSSNVEGHPHAVTETLRLMSREGLHKEIRLVSLSQSEVATLAEQMVKGTVDPELVEKLARDSQGNPLFTVESIRLLIESGNLVQADGTWSLSVDHLSMPTKVKEVILFRLGRLTSVQRRMLDLASVIGDRFDPALLSRILSEDKLDVLETLNTISHSTLLIQSEEDLYRFGHGKFREALYEEMSYPLKKEYHSRIAEDIEESTRDSCELPVSDLAFHYVRAGNKEKAIQYNILAGENSLRRFSNTEASRYFNYVLDNTDEQGYKDMRTIALEGLGDALSAMGRFEEAGRTFERLGKISESSETRLRSLRKAMFAYFWRGDLPHTLELASEAERDSNVDELEYAMVRMYRTKAKAFKGTIAPVDSIKEFESCLEVFEKRNSLSYVADALLEIGGLYSAESREEALPFLDRSISIYDQFGNYRRQAEAYFWLGSAYFFTGHDQEALEAYDKVIEIGKKTGDYNRMAWARLYSGLLYEAVWKLTEAFEDSLEGIGYAEKTDSYYVQSMIYANVTRVCAKLEDMNNLDKYNGKFRKFFEANKNTISRLAQAGGVRTEAVVFASKGQWDEANKHFEKCFELYQGAFNVTVHVPMAKVDYAWALKKQGRITDALAQLEEAKAMYKKVGCKANAEMIDKIMSVTIG